MPGGLARIERDHLSSYLDGLSRVDPDSLGNDEALAFWLNSYNAAAVRVAVDARSSGVSSVMRLPGAFDEAVLKVGGESLSLNDIEHGKIRRFRDPRIHGALVCGSISCPTLSHVPFTGDGLNAELDAQMRVFLGSGGAYVDEASGAVHLSRVLLWYGADFVRPGRMPSLLPATKSAVLKSVRSWLPTDVAAWAQSDRPKVQFQSYDWGLGCSVNRPSDG